MEQWVLGESASGRPQVEGSGTLLSLFWFVGVLLREEGKEERGKEPDTDAYGAESHSINL